jgi:hypothetical protein
MAVLFAILLGITQIGVYGRFYLMVLFGERQPAQLLELSARRPGPGARCHDLAALVRFEDRAGVEHEAIDRIAFDELPRPRHFATWQVVPFWPGLHHVGEYPRIGLHLYFWIAMLTGALVLGHFAQARRERRQRPWYEAERLVEEGLGPLPGREAPRRG